MNGPEFEEINLDTITSHWCDKTLKLGALEPFVPLSAYDSQYDRVHFSTSLSPFKKYCWYRAVTSSMLGLDSVVGFMFSVVGRLVNNHRSKAESVTLHLRLSGLKNARI